MIPFARILGTGPALAGLLCLVVAGASGNLAAEPRRNGGRATVAAVAKAAKPALRQLDLVMCIDATGSMQSTIDAVKANAGNIQGNLNNELRARGIEPFEAMRVKVVFFRDYGGNPAGGYWRGPWHDRTFVSDPAHHGDRQPLRASGFFDLATQAADFQSFVNPELAGGGGDIPESGLECLNEAMASPWAQAGQTIANGPHAGKVLEDLVPVIVVWTDAPAHAPGHARSLLNPSYPAATAMPRSYADLLAKWSNGAVINQANKLLVFFGNPDNHLPNHPGDDGWAILKTWPGYHLGGSLTTGNTRMTAKIADAIALSQKAPALSN